MTKRINDAIRFVAYCRWIIIVCGVASNVRLITHKLPRRFDDDSSVAATTRKRVLTYSPIPSPIVEIATVLSHI